MSPSWVEAKWTWPLPTEGARRYRWPNPDRTDIEQRVKCEAYRSGVWVEIEPDGRVHDSQTETKA